MKRHFALFFSFLLLTLAGCATVAPMHEKNMADVNGEKLELVRAGKDRPVIVLISGYGADVDYSWAKILPEVATMGTVIAYNRFGYGNSDRTEVPQTGNAVISTLRQLLNAEKLAPPYILVGHSIGGAYANLYARQYPTEVAGVVLLDSSHPDQEEKLRSQQNFLQRGLSRVLLALDKYVHSRHSELASFAETAHQIKQAGPFPDIPLTVITAGQMPGFFASEGTMGVHEENQRDLAAMSSQGRQIVAENSGHFVQNDEPGIVVNAIREIVNAVGN